MTETPIILDKLTKIRVITNWCDSFAIHDRIIDQYVSTKQFKDNLHFVNDDSYEWLVEFNDKKDFDIRVPKEKVIGFIQEPPDHDFFDRNIGSYCGVVYTCTEPEAYGIEGNLIGFPAGMFYHMDGDIEEYLQPIEKTKMLSMITSGIRGGFYEHRQNIARIIAGTGIGDVYGRGLRHRGVKGELGNKAFGLLPYKFTICMENGIWDDYISDKIIDAALCSCIPIYVGARNIKKHMPFAIELKHYESPRHAINEINEIIYTIDYDTHVQEVNKFKKKFLKKYSIYERIKSTIQQAGTH
jgi:hypothetical protein